MKVIDLLNKIANGEEVKEFYKNDELWQFDKKANEFHTNKRHKLKVGFLLDELNDEIEIIEEPKKIEKVKLLPDRDNNGHSYRVEVAHDNIKTLANKINKIIDYINKGE